MFEKKMKKIATEIFEQEVEKFKDENPLVASAVEHPVGALFCAGAAFGAGVVAVKGAAAILTAPFRHRHHHHRRPAALAPAPAPAPTPAPATAPAAAPEPAPVLEPDGIM